MPYEKPLLLGGQLAAKANTGDYRADSPRVRMMPIYCLPTANTYSSAESSIAVESTFHLHTARPQCRSRKTLRA
jgi:hypothetical protein